MLKKIARAIPPLRTAYRATREFLQRDELTMALHRKIFERGRLKLPQISPESVTHDNVAVVLPAGHPLFAGEDTPLEDMLFLLSLAKSRKVRRILEVGTYRARSTLAFHLNCPEADIVSYDIQILPSSNRTQLENNAHVELRLGSFSAAAEDLKEELSFDFIFIDGAHDFDSVMSDSRLAFEILADDGVIVWHDYRTTGYFASELQVPEALEQVKGERALFHVRGTTCAVYCRQSATRS